MVAYNIILVFVSVCVESVRKHRMIGSNLDELIPYEAPTQTPDIKPRELSKTEIRQSGNL